MKNTDKPPTDYRILKHFIGLRQATAIADALAGEEGDWMQGVLTAYVERIHAMPATYQTEGHGENAIVHLHYFKGGADWYIIEKDCEAEQLQAFGLADLYQDGGELGYINIEELIENHVELDLYWTPTPLKDVRRKTL